MICGSPDPFPIFEGGVRLRQTTTLGGRLPRKTRLCTSERDGDCDRGSEEAAGGEGEGGGGSREGKDAKKA